MSKPTHTPGPWEYDDGEIIGYGGAHVASISRPEDFPCMEDAAVSECEIECAANARLIAAAPELLKEVAALREYVDLCADAMTWLIMACGFPSSEAFMPDAAKLARMKVLKAQLFPDATVPDASEASR